MTTLRAILRWLACVFWHSDYRSCGLHRVECCECGREWTE